MDRLLTNILRSVGRIFPDCQTLAQAIAFNMFLAFFPLLLFALGILGVTSMFHDALREIPDRLNLILPPGSSDVVTGYFVRRALRPWTWMALGLGGTLLAGAQVMAGFMEGFRLIEGDILREGYWRRHLRALLMLCLTIVPMLVVIVLTVFGRQTRAWLMQETGSLYVTHELELTLNGIVVFTLAMIVLMVIYRIGRPDNPGYWELLPGAVVSTILWWVADVCFGFYVRKMPYDAVYRGLASAIGLLLWMFITALIVLLGAAYNAEAREEAIARDPARRPQFIIPVSPSSCAPTEDDSATP